MRFPAKKNAVCPKAQRDFPPKKDGILYPRRVVSGLPSPSHRVCVDGRTDGRTDVRTYGRTDGRSRDYYFTTKISRIDRVIARDTQRQNECVCANSFPPFSRAGANRETGFKRNHSGENGGNSKIPVICFLFAEIRPSRNR